MNLNDFPTFNIPMLALLLIGLTSIQLLLGKNWRWMLAALALQYVGVFVLAGVSWMFLMAVTKMVAGWMAGAVLGIGLLSVPTAWRPDVTSWPSDRLFRVMVAGLVGLALYSVAPQVQAWLPGATIEVVWGGLVLIAMGLLHLGLTAHPFRIALGLLTSLSGFEILYAVVETSALVAGLLAVVNLGVALAGTYLLIAPELQEESE